MARMIPNSIAPEVKSDAEKRVFKWFHDTTPSDWVVIHSLGVANHNKLKYGEIDFLVLAPGHGIFSIEVKGRLVKRTEDGWEFTNRYGKTVTKSYGPFSQAKDGIFSILKDTKWDSWLHNFAVMFPDMDMFPDTSPDHFLWQVCLKRDANDLTRFIRQLAENTEKQWRKNNKPVKKLDEKSRDELANILSPYFEVSKTVKLKNTEGMLNKLTDEQVNIFKGIEINHRVLIEGTAGTGKTFLAIEIAKSLVMAGNKVGFFCYNSMLGNFLKSQFKTDDLSLYVGTIHKYINQEIKNAGIRPKLEDGSDLFDELEKLKKDVNHYPSAAMSNDDLWEKQIPGYLLDIIKKNENIKKFDTLIIDEAQDLIIDGYIDIFENILDKGFGKGNWYLFGDFTGQILSRNIYTPDEMREWLGEPGETYFRQPLKTNCRNTQDIGREINKLTGYGTDEYLKNQIPGGGVKYYQYKSVEDQKEQIEGLISSLITTDKIKKSEITLLTYYSAHYEQKWWDLSVLSKLKDFFNLIEYKEKVGEISYSTIEQFKGMENNIIILTDVISYKKKKVINIGMSRASFELHVFESYEAKKERNELMNIK
jgi:archaellum biogenesis ATPase FlaH